MNVPWGGTFSHSRRVVSSLQMVSDSQPYVKSTDTDVTLEASKYLGLVLSRSLVNVTINVDCRISPGAEN